MCSLGKVPPPSILLYLESRTLIYRKSLEGSQEVKAGKLGLNPEPQSSQESTLLLSYVSGPELFIYYLFSHNLFIDYLL